MPLEHYTERQDTDRSAKNICRVASTGDFHHMARSFLAMSTGGISSQTRSSRTIKEHLRLADLYQRRLILVRVGDEEPAQAPPPGWRETI